MNIFRRMLFSEVTPLVKLSKQKNITEGDLMNLPEEINPRYPQKGLDNLNWNTPWGLLFSFVKVLKRFTAPAYGFYFISSILALLSPVFINKFVKLLSGGLNQENLYEALGYGVLLGFCGFLSGLSMQHYFFRGLKAYNVVVNILNEKIFRHSLKLSQKARQKNQVGDIVNHMSTDSESVADFPMVLGDFISALFLITGVVAMLFYYIGWSALAALIVLFTLAPLTQYVAKRFTKLDEEMMSHRDHRVTLMTQAMNSIRVVKYFAWEKSVSKEVTEIREKELSSRRRLAKAEVVSSLGYLGVSTMVLFVALAVHAWRGQTLDAAIIFTCISLFGLLEGPFGELSRLISRATTAKVGAQRIIKYLSEEEIEVNTQERSDLSSAVGISFKNVDLGYDTTAPKVLENLNIDIKPASSVAIVGPVGSGKSTLLMTLLGEISHLNCDV